MLGMEDHQPARQGDQPGHQEHDPAALPQAVEIVEEKLIKLSHASCSGRPCYPGSAWAIPTATPAPSTVPAQGKSTCRGAAQLILLYRTEERSVGKACSGTRRSGGQQDH